MLNQNQNRNNISPGELLTNRIVKAHRKTKNITTMSVDMKFEVDIMELRKDIEYIKKAQEENNKQHTEILTMLREVIDCKADKEEVKEINNKLWGAIIFIAVTLLSMIAWGITRWIEKN